MTDISDVALEKSGWHRLNNNWIKEGKTLFRHNDHWKFNGKIVSFIEQLQDESLNQRRYRHSFGELIDRLNICQLKEIFIPEKRETYTKQIQDIVHDIDLLCVEKNWPPLGKLLSASCNDMLMNRLIWENETNQRNGIDSGNDLKFTHSINTLRTNCYSLISELYGDSGEYKKDTLYPDPKWVPSLLANS